MLVTKKHEIGQNSRPPQINHGKWEQHHRRRHHQRKSQQHQQLYGFTKAYVGYPSCSQSKQGGTNMSSCFDCHACVVFSHIAVWENMKTWHISKDQVFHDGRWLCIKATGILQKTPILMIHESMPICYRNGWPQKRLPLCTPQCLAVHQLSKFCLSIHSWKLPILSSTVQETCSIW